VKAEDENCGSGEEVGDIGHLGPEFILWAQLRTSDRAGSDGVVATLEKIMTAVRKRFPKARIFTGQFG
jgi:hypothetical protein